MNSKRTIMHSRPFVPSLTLPLLLALGCLAGASQRAAAQPAADNGPLDSAPVPWFVDAVWYQIFPERFRNGDVTNDPTRASLAGTWAL